MMSSDRYIHLNFWRDQAEAWHEIMPGVRRRIVNHASSGMMVLYKIEPGRLFPKHNHPHAQFGVFLEGGGKFKIGEATHVMKKGDGYYIPPSVFHELVTDAGSPSVIVDFFTPERDDLLPEALEPEKL